MASDNYADKVAQTLLEHLRNGTAPWTKPWQPGRPSSLPYNAVSGTAYRGANSLYLYVVGLEQGYSDTRWMTYKQAQGLGAQVRRGETSTPIQFWQWSVDRPLVDAEGNVVRNAAGEPLKQTFKLDKPLVRAASVFNAEQIDGLPPAEPRPIPAPAERHNRAQKMLDMSGAKIRNIEGDRAYYSVLTDVITMPFPDQFLNKQDIIELDPYYATALHELGHWTGHPARLDRDLKHPFGSEEYAREELRAEIASLMLGDELGIGHDPRNHASYIDSWIKVLENDPREIFRAATAAQRITGYVLDLEKERQITQQQSLDPILAVGPDTVTQTNDEQERNDMTGQTKLYLSVPYADRVEARQLGARWDKEAKAWWIGSNIDPAPFQKWQQGIATLVGDKGLDPISSFATALTAAGLKLKGPPIMDGILHRVPVEGDKGHQRSGSYIGFTDGRPSGVIQNFKAGTKTTWKADVDVAFDKDAADRIAAQAAAKRAEREAATVADQTQAAARAIDILKAAQTAVTHEYLTRKQVAPHGLKLDEEQRLLVPIADFDGKIMSLQRISPDGTKSFMKGGRLVGGQHTIGKDDPDQPLVIAEGYSTAASVHQITGLAVSVAFNASNLKAVAEAAREKWPNREIIIAGDNDVELTARAYPDGRRMPNIGVLKATEAATAVNGFAVIAPHDRDLPRSLDWNDIVRHNGLDQAKTTWRTVYLEAQYDSPGFREAAQEHRQAGLDVYYEELRDAALSAQGWRAKALHELRENVMDSTHDVNHWQATIDEREKDIGNILRGNKASLEFIQDVEEGRADLHFTEIPNQEELSLLVAEERATINYRTEEISAKQEEIATIKAALQDRSKEADVEAEI